MYLILLMLIRGIKKVMHYGLRMIQLGNLMTKKVFVASLLFTCAIFLFILMMDYGPNPFENNNALFIQVTAQKFIAFCILLNTYFQANESLKYT